MSDLQLVPTRRLIDDVVTHGRRHWRQILPSVALAQFGMGLMTLLLQDQQLALASSTNPSMDDLVQFFGLLFPLLFVMISVVIVSFTAVMVAAMDGLEGRPIDMKRAWGFALRPKVYLTNGLVNFVVALSVMACILPVLYFGPLLTFVLPVMIHQEVLGFEAIRRGASLAKYNPTGLWKDSSMIHILGVMLAGFLVSYAVSFVAQLPVLIVQAVMTMRQAAEGLLSTPVVPPLWLQVPTQALVAVVSTASWIYWCFAIAALYREVLRRRDGGDLQNAIDGMTGGPQSGGPQGGSPPPPPVVAGPTHASPPAYPSPLDSPSPPRPAGPGSNPLPSEALLPPETSPSPEVPPSSTAPSPVEPSLPLSPPLQTSSPLSQSSPMPESPAIEPDDNRWSADSDDGGSRNDLG